ncbi:hypothetical protein [Methylobacterium symbioticum]|uniref:Uncharacterized protein n=1 Tax=Methylobacterium symbioticum TaxID=2584084 RepID=A0A509EGI6_9HYPH|nr:hypothetical protein [Methylobacterium symbioticum]VUD73486.1 hypothetical protein MET9862_04103 [Methylobacterium symbioticum]
MPVESWIKPDEAPDMAAAATAMIDAALSGSGLSREAYWAAVRKGYNTPYNDPPARQNAEPAVTITVTEEALPVAVMAAAGTAEIRAV